MKNRYFQEMQRIGIKFRKGKYSTNNESSLKLGLCPPYSQGQSYAYKYWAIADRYNANEIVVDELPDSGEISVMLKTFALAGIKSIVVRKEQEEIVEVLKEYGCRPICECKVFRQETQLYLGKVEIIKGLRIRINE